MEKPYKQIPFDIELAKDIQSGKVKGKIVTDRAQVISRILCYDKKATNDGHIVALVDCNQMEYVGIFSNDGRCFDKEAEGIGNLYIELPEEAPMQDSINKKLHNTAEVLATPKHEFKVGDKVVYAGIMGYITNINKNLLVDIDPVICGIFHNVNISEIKFIDDSSTDKPKYDFKPFDRVLVRDNEKQVWLPRLFDSHVEQADFWTQDGKSWKICIPYEGHEYLVGTTNNPKED